MFRLNTLWHVPVSLLLSSVLGIAPVKAQTSYPFNADYDILATARDLTPNLEQIFLSGSSTNAPYSLTKLDSLSYSQTNFTTGAYSFNTDPTAFGLQGVSSGYVTFSGSDGDKLFGTESGTGLIDFNTLTVKSSATVSITGGSGRFQGATGTLISSQIQPLSLQVGVELKGQAEVSGSVKTVPEPGITTALLGMSVLGCVCIILRQQLFEGT